MATTKFCPQCGTKISPHAKFCAGCGSDLSSSPSPSPPLIEEKSEKSAVTALLLCMFLGSLGIHRFYVGKIKTGILMLITGGGLGIWTLIDLITIACCDFTDSNGKYLIFSRGRASPLKLILIIIGSVLAALIVYVVSIVALVFYLTAPMTNVIQNQLTALRAGNIDKAYSYMANQTKVDVTLNDFKQFMQTYPIMTTNVSASFPERKISDGEGYAAGTLVTKEGTKTIVEYRLAKENNQWKIVAIRINKPTATQTPGKTETNAYKLYEDKTYHYSIKYPADWVYELTDHNTILFYGKKGTSSYFSTVSIFAVEGKNKSIHDVMDILKKHLTSKYKKVQFTDSGEVTLPLNTHFHGEYVIATYYYKDIPMKMMQSILTDETGKLIYVWGYIAPVKFYNQDLPVAKAMYESWLIE